jgi:uncharacterized protein (DUF427 family)
MADHITISRAEGTWVVRAGGAVLAESAEALELRERDFPPVIYFPRKDIAMAFLEASDHREQSPAIGEAHFYTIAGKSGPIENAGWTYEAPAEAAGRIAGHIAFRHDAVTVEQL